MENLSSASGQPARPEPPAVRRSDRAFADPAGVADVLRRGEVGHLGLTDAAGPYVVPVSYGFVARDDGITIYLHGAGEGRKAAAIAAGLPVCFEVAIRHGLHGLDATVCDLGVDYESVIGFGRGRLVTDPAERRAGLVAVVDHYQPGRGQETPDPAPDRVTLLALDLTTWSGKRCLPPGAVPAAE